jgi:hypothetical protein
MLFKEIIAVYAENHTKQIQNVASLTVKADGTYSHCSALNTDKRWDYYQDIEKQRINGSWSQLQSL